MRGQGDGEGMREHEPCVSHIRLIAVTVQSSEARKMISLLRMDADGSLDADAD